MEPTSQAARPQGTLGSRAQSGHFFMINFVRKTLKHLYHEKWGKVLLVMFLVGLVATSAASVYVFFYTSGTATVRTPDLKLVKGTDISASCTAYPCASGSVASTGDLFTATMSWFPATTGSITPVTDYDNFTTIQSSANTHTITGVSVVGVGGTTADFGSISVYLCSTHTAFSASGAAPCATVCTFSSTAGCSVATSATINSGAANKYYIEVSAYAASGASASTSVTFQIAVQWA